MNAAHHESDDGGAIDVGMRGVATVYARALLGATQNTGNTETVIGELDALVDDVLGKLPQVDQVLSSALVSAADKATILDRALAGKVTPLLLNFLKVLAEHGRLNILREVRHVAHRLYDEIRGVVRVEMVTATPVDDQFSAQIAERLRPMLGAEPRLERSVDPKLIGGLLLRAGDIVLDGSVATQLDHMREQMIQRSIHEIQRRRDRFGTPAGN
jgi:F-type H+-transporting ATPase subunit delta